MPDSGRRVAKRFATREQMESALALCCEELAEAICQRMPDSYERAQQVRQMIQELELLRPHWLDGMTMEEAVAAYRAAGDPVPHGNRAAPRERE
jgi:hypothetical protein